MSFFEGCILSLLIFPAASLTGYAIVGLLRDVSPGLRLCLSSLAGLGQWLWLVATINLFQPLDRPTAWSILGGSWLLTALLPYARNALRADLRTWWMDRPARWLALCPLPMLALLLLPLLIYPGQIFYDGTSNHDSFFWISAAEWLQQHPYLATPDPARDLPLFSVTGAITGLQPAWGRMGAEGLLALVSSALNIAPIKAYIFGQAGLFPLWLAGLAVFVQSTLCRRPPLWSLLLGGALQPLYHFYAANNNMPNLLGALFAPVILAGFLQLTTPAPVLRWGWILLTAFSVHGLLCTYPEMAPFVLLVAGVGVLVKLPAAHQRKALVSTLIWVGAAGLLSLVLQPWTTWRAYGGFINSFLLARADTNWGNLFEPLSVAAYLPALVTLSIPALREIGPVGGVIATGIVLTAGWLVVRRAEDRRIALVALLGSFLLVAYTLVTGFNYGWQKASQFSGIFIAGWFTTGALALLPPREISRWALADKLRVGSLIGFLAFTTAWTGYRGVIRAEEKALDSQWLSLRSHSRTTFAGQHVEVVGATFLLPFFHSMWSIYALPYSAVRFDPRGEQMGGYLREQFRALPAPATPPQAYLVSRAWADSFDAGIPQISSGRYHALLPRTNKVLAVSGVFPTNGVPHSAKSDFSLTLLPASTGTFTLQLTPKQPQDSATLLTLRYGPPDTPDAWQSVTLASPWQVRVPIKQGTPIQLDFHLPLTSELDFPVRLSGIRVITP